MPVTQKEKERVNFRKRVVQQETKGRDLDTELNRSKEAVKEKDRVLQAWVLEAYRRGSQIDVLGKQLQEQEYWRQECLQQGQIIYDLRTILKNVSQSQHDYQNLRSTINAHEQRIAALSAKIGEHNKRLKEIPRTATVLGCIPLKLSFAQDPSEQGDLASVSDEKSIDTGPGVDLETTSRDSTILAEDVLTQT